MTARLAICYLALASAISGTHAASLWRRGDAIGGGDLVPKRGGGARRSALAAQWQPCYAEPGIKLVGDEIAKVTDVQESRHCCVACKNVPACTAWSYNTDSRKCKLFTPGTYSREECKIGVVGVLRWRLERDSSPSPPAEGASPIVTPSPVVPEIEAPASSDAFAPAPADGGIPSPAEGGGALPQDPGGFNGGFAPAPGAANELNPVPSDPGAAAPAAAPADSFAPAAPAAPPLLDPNATREQKLQYRVPGKVVGGRRLNSVLPCRGNAMGSADQCAGSCVGSADCQGWTFAQDFDCSWTGQAEPTGLCYLMGDVTPEGVYDVTSGDTFVSAWAAP